VVQYRLNVPRAIDTGGFGSRLPDTLERPARRLFARLGILGRQGRAA
jgi:hypothetical protein